MLFSNSTTYKIAFLATLLPRIFVFIANKYYFCLDNPQINKHLNRMKKSFYAICLFIICTTTIGCNNKESVAQWVDPMIGTDYHAHTFPGATLPHGFVQLSPDNGPGGWDWCGGYHSSDETIIGFSHTHISGTGVRDLCDITIMPQVGDPVFEFGSKDDPDTGYRSRIKHSTEQAEAGYYSVYLEDPKIKAELTATRRCGYHRYTFDNPSNQHFILDFNYWNGNATRKASFRVVDDRTIEGVRVVRGWAPKREIYFYAVFSEPFSEVVAKIDDKELGAVTEGEGRRVTLAAKFDKPAKEITVKVGISSVSCEGAKLNYNTEIADKSFNKVRREAKAEWEQALSKIEIEASETDKRIFYTSLYHTLVAPITFNDVDGNYRGMDGKIHNSGNEDHYTIFSFWDTFRAAHPLYTIIEPERNEAYVRSIIEKWKQLGMLPMWELHCNDTRCMIGYHAASVIVDSYMKGYRNFDHEEAMKAMVATAERDEFGIKYVKELGYIPADKEGSSVSMAVEYAYDDWCIALMAKQMGKKDIYDRYITRAQYYKNYYDPTDLFFKGRYSNGKFTNDVFNANQIYHSHYVEGNAWHYAFFAPQDVEGHIELMGGDDRYVARLDEMFDAETPAGHGDVTGNIGQYSHGNEPSHHAAYLYAYAGKPWKTQQRIKRIIDEMYNDTRSGLCGNEDCGQMSAWYVLSAMGFYQVAPGSNDYILGTPRFAKTQLNLTNGKTLKIVAENLSAENFYVQQVRWNGQPYAKSYITHDMITSGGELTFVMGSTPNEEFGAATEARPKSHITDKKMSAEELLANPAKH